MKLVHSFHHDEQQSDLISKSIKTFTCIKISWNKNWLDFLSYTQVFICLGWDYLKKSELCFKLLFKRMVL